MMRRDSARKATRNGAAGHTNAATTHARRGQHGRTDRIACAIATVLRTAAPASSVFRCSLRLYAIVSACSHCVRGCADGRAVLDAANVCCSEISHDSECLRHKVTSLNLRDLTVQYVVKLTV